MMFIIETQEASSRMRFALVITVIVLAVALGAMNLWKSKATSDWVLTGTMVGSALGMCVVAWIVVTWLRNRQCRRLTDMRDSALW